MKTTITFIVALVLTIPLYSQNNKTGIGAGITFQYGANPRADYLIWDVETQNVSLQPESKFFVGPILQFKNFKKIQGEIGFLYGRTNYLNTDNTIPNSQDVRVNEYQIPIRVLYNAPSPIKYHSALVYNVGVNIGYLNIPAQGMIYKDYNFISPSVTAGIRLATEIRSFGRFEYGVSYVKNLRDHYSFMFQNDDANPSQASIRQRMGQIRINLIYFFSPRVYSWSKTRYKLASVD